MPPGGRPATGVIFDAGQGFQRPLVLNRVVVAAERWPFPAALPGNVGGASVGDAVDGVAQVQCFEIPGTPGQSRIGATQAGISLVVLQAIVCGKILPEAGAER